MMKMKSFQQIYKLPRHQKFKPMNIYTDEDLKWDKPPMEVCLLIHLSVTLPLNK